MKNAPKYPRLFSEGKIGKLTIPNRVNMPAMGTLLCAPDGGVSDHQIAYYEERARGGVGLIVTEIMAVEYDLGRAVTVQLRGDDDSFIPMLSRLAAAVHKYPTRIFTQLHHAGSQCNSRITCGEQIVAASAVTNKAVGEEPRALSTGEVEELVGKFVSAAERSQVAGFDGVQLHGAHGYLINQFLSPHSNRRSDRYGGSFENRMRFVTEIIQGIKGRCGQDFPVMVRFSADEFVEGGINLDEGKRIAQGLESAGADALDVSCGTYESMPTLLEPITYDQGWRVYMAEAVKEVVKIPVAAVGVIRQPAFAEEVIASGRADFVSVGRDLLTDPAWVSKAREGRDEEICQCISCLYCIETIFSAKPIACAVNSRVGRERDVAPLSQLKSSTLPAVTGDGGEARAPKGAGAGGSLGRVAVIGGGPGGMEAARTLAMRGYSPIVYEREAQLGGELVPGCRPPKKHQIAWYKDFLIGEMERLGVEVRLNTEATPDMVRQEDVDGVVVAVGATSMVPSSIEGLQGVDQPGSRMVTAEAYLWGRTGEVGRGERVMVVGGGLTGCETAERLAEQGAKAYLAEGRPDVAVNAHPINQVTVKARMAEAGVETMTGKKLLRVEGGVGGGGGAGVVKALLEDVRTGEQHTVELDWLVLSLGLEVRPETVRPWQESFSRVRVIGDALAPRRVAQAVREGFDAGWTWGVE